MMGNNKDRSKEVVGVSVNQELTEQAAKDKQDVLNGIEAAKEKAALRESEEMNKLSLPGIALLRKWAEEGAGTRKVEIEFDFCLRRDLEEKIWVYDTALGNGAFLTIQAVNRAGALELTKLISGQIEAKIQENEEREYQRLHAKFTKGQQSIDGPGF